MLNVVTAKTATEFTRFSDFVGSHVAMRQLEVTTGEHPEYGTRTFSQVEAIVFKDNGSHDVIDGRVFVYSEAVRDHLKQDDWVFGLVIKPKKSYLFRPPSSPELVKAATVVIDDLEKNQDSGSVPASF